MAEKEIMEEMLKKINEIAKKEVAINFADSDVDLYAFFNEYGTAHIPARPFFRTALEWNKELDEKVKITIDDFLSGKFEKPLEFIGEHATNKVRSSILNGKWIRNAQSTVKKKGFDKPLIETGRMWKNVKWEVRNSGTNS